MKSAEFRREDGSIDLNVLEELAATAIKLGLTKVVFMSPEDAFWDNDLAQEDET